MPDGLFSILYIPHGGGPLPLLGDGGHHAMVRFLEGVRRELVRPRAILVVSAHWEEPVATVTSGAHPQLIYDYSGFPPESYEIEYPAAGDPRLAARILEALDAHGIDARADGERGFDHGLFVPLKLMFPEASIPCVQLSLRRGLDPGEHLRIGAALTELKGSDVLVVGSGFSFHNLRSLLGGSSMPDEMNDSFQGWLLESCTDRSLTEPERRDRLAGWSSAPFARYCHPREEHLLPLHVCQGMAGEAATVIFDADVMGKRALGLAW